MSNFSLDNFRQVNGRATARHGVAGLGPCTIAGQSFSTCAVTSNVDRRRPLYLENPRTGQGYGPLVRYDDVGEQSYRGLKLSVRRRSDAGLSLSANYTVARCEADTSVSGSPSASSAAGT